MIVYLYDRLILPVSFFKWLPENFKYVVHITFLLDGADLEHLPSCINSTDYLNINLFYEAFSRLSIPQI